MLLTQGNRYKIPETDGADCRSRPVVAFALMVERTYSQCCQRYLWAPSSLQNLQPLVQKLFQLQFPANCFGSRQVVKLETILSSKGPSFSPHE